MPVGPQLHARVFFIISASSVEADVPGEHCKKQEVSMHRFRGENRMQRERGHTLFHIGKSDSSFPQMLLGGRMTVPFVVTGLVITGLE